METYFDKPIGTQVTTLSNSVTQLTEGVNNTQDGLAIVANGNTHPQIASGQYVYVKNHESLADGLYKASTAISTNDPLSTSNLTADDSGGLNDLKDSVDSLSEKIGTVPSGETVEGQISALSSKLTTRIVTVTASLTSEYSSSSYHVYYGFVADSDIPDIGNAIPICLGGVSSTVGSAVILNWARYLNGYRLTSPISGTYTVNMLLLGF